MKTTTAAVFIILALSCVQAKAAEDLDISRSIDLALKNNLSVKLAAAAGDVQKAEALAAAARLLPSVELSVSQERTFKRNLTAMGYGYAPGGGANLLGPFDTFDARLRLVFSVLDLSARGQARSKKEEEKMGGLRLDLVKEQVAAAAALAYLDVLRSAAAENSAIAGREMASSLRELAENKHEAGTATGLDVVRAKTREAEESLRVSRARTLLEESRLRLKHLLGLPFASGIALTEELSFSPDPQVDADEAVKEALSARLELAIARAGLSAREHALKAANGARLPALAISGASALSGQLPDHEVKLVGDIGIAAKLPLFSGGRIGAGIDAAAALKTQAGSRLADAAIQVEEEVRVALYRLLSSAEEVTTASMTVTLAEQELEMTRDRFSAGVGDNVDLVNAQTALSRARDSSIDALSRHKDANIHLTLALGRMKHLKF